MSSEPPTFSSFLGQEQVPVDLQEVLCLAAEGGARIAEQMRKAGLGGCLGSTGRKNVQGETVKKMDLVANDILVDTFRQGNRVCRIASEEMDNSLEVPGAGPFAVLFDPLDGSSNIDVDGTVGSIFSIFRLSEKGAREEASILRKGTEQAAAGYLNYGPATVLALTTGAGTHQFTFDAGRKEFLLTARDMKIPSKGKIYAANEGQRAYWHPSTRKFLEFLQTPDPDQGRPYSTRYSGCLVSDVHRILLEGGIYFYPSDTRDPKKPHGKLRLLYECAPLGWLVEQAGGRASTGRGPIREVEPTQLHHRVPIFIGSPTEVAWAEKFEMESV